MLSNDLQKFENEAQKIKKYLEEELTSFRTGRANPALVKDILVDYYGTKTRLEGLASVGVQDARTLVIHPWDKNSFEFLEKAIRGSNLGLQPIVDKEVIRVVLPELTGERRQALLKLVVEKLEEVRISLRRERDDVWKNIQLGERSGDISEDEKFRLKDDLQKSVDKFNSEFEEIVERKKREIQE